MKVLVIDTCGTTGSVALADTEAGVIAVERLPGRSASERLVATARLIAEKNELPIESLGAIAVVHGPGSFTGVRVGLSAAKGLCEGLGLPLVAISRLVVLASLVEETACVCALLDAGRGEFYCGEYAAGLCLREGLLTREQVVAAAAGSVVVVCEETVASAVVELAPHIAAEPDAVAAWPLALQRIRAEAFDDVALIDANYLRRTDAEIFAKKKP